MKLFRALALALAGALLLTGCDFDVYKLPLPGGTDTGSNPMTVKAEFRDVLDLVPKSTVKVNDVSVGQVTDVELDGYHAMVTMQIRNDVDLPDNAIAEIRQTSLLGEKFVSLSPPTSDASSNRLGDGDTIPLSRTGRNPEVEEVLGALSLLLNGGGVAQLKTITTEVNKALGGREDATRSVLDQISRFMGQLDQHKQDIVDAIDSVNRLAVSVRQQQGSIDKALEQLPSALTSLDQQRGDLIKMLHALDRLSGVGVRVIKASKDSTIETLRQLNPVLTEIGNSGDAFVKAFNVFLTYPFVDEVVGRDPQVARNLHMGDYTNLSVQLDLTLPSGGPSLPTAVPTTVCIPFSAITDITHLPALKKLCDGARKRLNRCLKDLKDGHVDRPGCRRLVPGTVKDAVGAVCQASPLQLPAGLCPKKGGGSGGGGSGGGSGGGGLPHLPGLGRAGVGPTRGPSDRGPTMGQLSRSFDPALVQLLVPGMVTR